MSLANNINEKLDEILKLRAEINRMKKDLNKSDTLINAETGEKATQEDALKYITTYAAYTPLVFTRQVPLVQIGKLGCGRLGGPKKHFLPHFLYITVR